MLKLRQTSVHAAFRGSKNFMKRIVRHLRHLRDRRPAAPAMIATPVSRRDSGAAVFEFCLAILALPQHGRLATRPVRVQNYRRLR